MEKMEKGGFSHLPVLLFETIEALNIDPDGVYIDATAGGGGHAFEIAKRLNAGRLIAIDKDGEAIDAARERLSPFLDKVSFVRGDFKDIKEIAEGESAEKISGILADIGMSSHQIDEKDRGFSYIGDAPFPLDMRMDRRQALTAADIVNTWDENELSRIFFSYGEERFSKKIARAIVSNREKAPIRTTDELCSVIKGAIPGAALNSGGHYAKRVFQALRICVNDELGALRSLLSGSEDILRPGGILAVITFHSLEDRIVKDFFKQSENPCTCPKDFPVCVCGKKPTMRVLSKKPITASIEEIKRNKRSKSAKLRWAVRL